MAIAGSVKKLLGKMYFGKWFHFIGGFVFLERGNPEIKS
jgi:hypothetical protein